MCYKPRRAAARDFTVHIEFSYKVFSFFFSTFETDSGLECCPSMHSNLSDKMLDHSTQKNPSIVK